MKTRTLPRRSDICAPTASRMKSWRCITMFWSAMISAKSQSCTENGWLQAEKTRVAMFKPKFQGIDTTPLTKADCTPISHEDDLNGKVVVIKPEVLRREYQMATNQIKLCTGGFGAYPHSRGSACFCVDLYSGKESRFERQDILGTLERSRLPQWAALGLDQYRNEHRQKPHKGREER